MLTGVTAENMHHFIDDVGHLEVTALGVFLERARGMYDDNLSGYLKVMLRRSFGRIMVSGWRRSNFPERDRPEPISAIPDGRGCVPSGAGRCAPTTGLL
jgi:hypothetical protein